MVHFGVIYGPDILGLLSGLQTVTSTSPSMVLVEERPPWPRDHCFTNSITVCFFSTDTYTHIHVRILTPINTHATLSL